MNTTVSLTEPTDRTSAATRREHDPGLLAAVTDLHGAASNATAAIAVADLLPAERRRAEKVTRQIRALARLIANGSRLEPAPVDAVVKLATREATRFASRATWEVTSVDADGRRLRAVLHQVHAWRGHNGCLPSTED